MRDLLKRLTQLATGTGLANWLGPVVSLLLFRPISYVVKVEDYGVAENLSILAAVLATLALVGLPAAVTTHFNDRPDDEGWQRELVTSALVVGALISLLVGVLTAIFGPQLVQRVWQAQPAYAPHADLMVVIGGLLVFLSVSLLLLQIAQTALRARWLVWLSVASLSGLVFAKVGLVILLRLGVDGLVMSTLLSGLAVCLVAAWVMRPLIGRPTARAGRALLASGILLFPGIVADLVLRYFDRLNISGIVTPAEVGYYQTAAKMAGIAHLAIAPFFLAWVPLALSIQTDERRNERYAAMARYLVAVALAVGLALGLFSRQVLMIMAAPSYWPAAPYVGFLAYRQIFTAMLVLLSTIGYANKQLKEISWATVAGAIGFVVLNLVLAPRYGLWGATAAAALGLAIGPALLYVALQRQSPVPYPTGRILAAFGIQLALLVAGLFVPAGPWWQELAMRFALAALLPLTFVAIGLVTPSEVAAAWEVISRRGRAIMKRGGP